MTTPDVDEPVHEISDDAYTSYVAARARRDEAQAEMDGFKDALVDAVPEDVRLISAAGVHVLRLTRSTASRIDTTRLRRDYPDIAAMYSKSSDSIRLELVK